FPSSAGPRTGTACAPLRHRSCRVRDGGDRLRRDTEPPRAGPSAHPAGIHRGGCARLSTVAVAGTFPPGSRGGALGMITSTRGFGHSVGPITGGALGEWLGWRGLFGIPITLALVLTPLALRSLPNGRA